MAIVTALAEPALPKVLPGSHLFGVRYRQWPVAVRPAKGLRSSNVFAVAPDGKVTVCTSTDDLTKFFKAHLVPVNGAEAAKDAARAYLRSAEELHQDGFYKFERQEASTQAMVGVSGVVSRATSVVMAGGNGNLTVQLGFDRGKLVRAEEKAMIRRGIRPRCQATLLLHADPLVRRIAEQDLLVMGRTCKPYLDEQRAKASPELREAIDRVWRRIAEQDR
jgi:hypothetical protein